VASLLPAGTSATADPLAGSELWYAPILREHFPSEIPIHGWDYPISEIPCLPKDITKFHLQPDVTSALGPRAFRIRGSVELSSVPPPFEVVDGAKGRRYLLHLQAYLFSPTGQLVWSQQGFPAGDAWIAASGGSREFTLIDLYQGPTQGYELIVLAAGDPIFSDSAETRVILGAKRLVVP
jgi:hypothetical protein